MHAFYSHVYHRSLRFISYKATMAKEKEYLVKVHHGLALSTLGELFLIFM